MPPFRDRDVGQERSSPRVTPREEIRLDTTLEQLDAWTNSHCADPHDEPSVEWGWHGSFPKATRIMGWLTAAVMFLMFIVVCSSGWPTTIWARRIGI